MRGMNWEAIGLFLRGLAFGRLARVVLESRARLSRVRRQNAPSGTINAIPGSGRGRIGSRAHERRRPHLGGRVPVRHDRMLALVAVSEDLHPMTLAELLSTYRQIYVDAPYGAVSFAVSENVVISFAPLRELQIWQAGTILSLLCKPPLVTATMWSRVNLTISDSRTPQ